jgi:hypothetical protein
MPQALPNRPKKVWQHYHNHKGEYEHRLSYHSPQGVLYFPDYTITHPTTLMRIFGIHPGLSS